MKKILSIISLLSLALMSYGQNITFATTYNITGTTSLVSGNTYSVTGNVVDFNGIYNGASIAVGDSLFYLEDGVIYAGAVTLITSTSGNQATFRFLSTEALLSTSSAGAMSGQINISRKNAQGYCAVAAGTNEALRWALENRFKKLLASDVKNAKEVSKYVGGTGVLPLFTPLAGEPNIAQNTVGQLSTWDGMSWKFSGSSLLVGDSTNISTIITGESKIKSTLITQNGGTKNDSIVRMNANTRQLYLSDGGALVEFNDTIAKTDKTNFLTKNQGDINYIGGVEKYMNETLAPNGERVIGLANMANADAFIAAPATDVNILTQVAGQSVKKISQEQFIAPALEVTTQIALPTAYVSKIVNVVNATDTMQLVWVANKYMANRVKSLTSPVNTSIVDFSLSTWENTSISTVLGQAVEYKKQQDRWRSSQPLTSLDFGADEKGQIDATASIQKQIDELDVVVIPEGEFRIDGTLVITKLWQKIILNGKLIRKSTFSTSTSPVLQFKYSRASISGVGTNATIESENDSPDGIVLIGTQNLTGVVPQANILFNMIKGINVRGNLSTTSIGIKMNSTQGFAGNDIANYCNTVSDNMIERVSEGIHLATNCNGNIISNNFFIQIGKYCINLHGAEYPRFEIYENLISNVFVHFSGTLESIVHGTSAIYNQISNLHGEAGSGKMYDWDVNSFDNTVDGTNNMPLGSIDANKNNWYKVSGDEKNKSLIVKNTVSIDGGNPAASFDKFKIGGEMDNPFLISFARKFSNQNWLISSNLGTNNYTDEFTNKNNGLGYSGIEFVKQGGNINFFSSATTEAGVFYNPNKPLTVNPFGIKLGNLTQSQINAIPSPEGGTVVFNSETDRLNFRQNSNWIEIPTMANTVTTNSNVVLSSGQEYMVYIPIAGVTTSSIVHTTWNGTKPNGVIVQSPEMIAGHTIIRLNNTTGADQVIDITFKSLLIKN